MTPEDKRRAIVARARTEVGSQRAGGERVYQYWREVLPRAQTNAQVRQYAKTKAWCGGFALWCLRAEGIALAFDWLDGRGFVGPAGLRTTRTPEPGDIGYLHVPWQHYCVVELYEPAAQRLVSIDGNQPDCRRYDRKAPAGMVYYSIAPLLAVTSTVAAPPFAHEYATLRRGDEGPAVEVLQLRLAECGFYAGRIDGSFGPVTFAAVRAFQSFAKLTVDGVAGPKTLAELEPRYST